MYASHRHHNAAADADEVVEHIYMHIVRGGS